MESGHEVGVRQRKKWGRGLQIARACGRFLGVEAFGELSVASEQGQKEMVKERKQVLKLL